MTSFMAALQLVREQKRRQKQYDALVGSQLNYEILKDLVNQAQQGVVVHVKGKDFELDIRREDHFDRLKMARENW